MWEGSEKEGIINITTVKFWFKVEGQLFNQLVSWWQRNKFAKVGPNKSWTGASHCLRAPSECLLAQTNLSITRSWHQVVVPADVICSTIDPAMSSKGTAEERQFLIEFIEEYRSLPALWCVTSTEYSNRNKKNEQSGAKLLNKYKEKYLNVEKKYVTNKKKINQ